MTTPARLAETATFCAQVARDDYATLVRRFGPRVESIYKGFMVGHSDPGGFEWPVRKRTSAQVREEGLTPKLRDRRDAEFRLYISTTAQDAAVVDLWKRHKVVYSVHPELAVELADTDPASVIPARLVTQLPHPNPFLALAEPAIIPLQQRMPGEEGVAIRVLGAFIFGNTVEGALVSTDDSRAVQLGLQFAEEVIDAHGTPVTSRSGEGPDFAWARMKLPIEEQTLGQLTEDVLDRFVMATVNGDGLPDNEELVRKLLTLVVPQVIYLCAKNAETRPVPAVAMKRKADGTTWKKPPRVIEVGYRLGPVLGKARKSYQSGPSESTGRVMPPHIRRAHYQRFWTGPRSGPQVAVVHWVAPTPVNMKPGEDVPKPVIVGVR